MKVIRFLGAFVGGVVVMYLGAWFVSALVILPLWALNAILFGR